MASLVKIFLPRSRYILERTSFKSMKTINKTSTVLISTSKRDKEIAALQESLARKFDPTKQDKPPKEFISWGFDKTNVETDNTKMHMTYFYGISLGICFLGFLMIYRPDHKMYDWTRREAFIELRRREENGLPAIDRNFVPLDRIELPAEEDLGSGVEIIV